MKVKMRKSVKGQEEMLGFALIMIVVAVILLVLLGFSLGRAQKQETESYEVESFIWAFLQYTTDCAENYEFDYVSIQNLIFKCNNKKACLDERDSCAVLDENLRKIAEEGWKGKPIQGYEMSIWAEGENLLFLEEGNKTKDSRGAVQDFSKGGESINISFSAYY